MGVYEKNDINIEMLAMSPGSGRKEGSEFYRK
jgi:hypothetical protein